MIPAELLIKYQMRLFNQEKLIILGKKLLAKI